MDEENDDNKTWLTRRTFVQSLGVALSCPMWSACEFAEVEHNLRGEDVEFRLDESEYSDLQEVGATACIDAGSLPLLLIRRDEETVLALERFCPHEQKDMAPCGGNPEPAQWDPDQKQLICQWHFSIFAEDGEVVSGPSPRPLRKYPVEFDPDSGEGVVRASEGPEGDSQ